MNKFYAEDAAGGGGEAKPANVLAAPAPATVSTTEAAKHDIGTKEPFYKGWIGEGGKLDKGRYDMLPERLQDKRKSLEKFNDIETFVDSYAHLETLVGKKGLMPLRPDASDGEKQEFNTRIREVLGVPDDIKEYGIKRPDDMPEQYWNQAYADKMLETIHKNNIPPAAARELVKVNEEFTRNELMRLASEQEKAEDARIADVNKAAAKEWGNDVQAKLADARRGAKFLGIDPDGELFANNPDVAFAMQRAAEYIKESRMVADETSGADTGKSAEDELRAMTTDPANKYYKALMDDGHPGHREAARIQELLAAKVAKERNRR